jgi:hypothetical protein
MKFTIKYVAAIAMAILFASCSDDDNNAQPNTYGDAEIFFDNGVAGDALVLGSNYTNSNDETLKIEHLNYIVSNFVLIDENGNEFTYPKEESYFVISEEAEMLTAHLENIPAGNYKQIKFGIGVDNQRYLQGETAQQSFWDLAAQHNLTWTWSTGYKFILFEGTFTTPLSAGQKGFMVHQGSNSSTDNYREVTLNLPTTARVRAGEMPSIHIKTDVNVLLDGTNKILLFDNLNPAGTSAGIMGGENLVKIAANSLSMFTVDHVHNGAGSPH